MSAQASVFLPNNAVPNQAAIVGGLVPLDLSSVGIVGLSGANNNIYTESFASSVPGAYTGVLTSTVYGNTGMPGASLDTVLIVYEFVGNGPDGIDVFDFGIDSGANLDFGDLLAATHGTIASLNSPGQMDPIVALTNNVMVNNRLTFDFLAAGDALGTFAGTDTYSWYVLSSADVQINLVDVLITDFGVANARALSLVNIPGQPDIGVPAPGAVALLGLGLGLAGARRRRA